MLGRMARRPSEERMIAKPTPEEFIKAHLRSDITGLMYDDDELFLFLKNKFTSISDPSTNLFLTAKINSLGRIKMHKHMKSILNCYEGSKIISVNTDQLMYIVPKHYGHEVVTQEGFGGLRNELLPDTVVESIQHLDARNCNVVTKNTETGIITQNPKVRGLVLEQAMTSGKIETSSFANLLRNQSEKLTLVHAKSHSKDILEPPQIELTTHTMTAKHVDSKRHCDLRTMYFETNPYGKNRCTE